MRRLETLTALASLAALQACAHRPQTQPLQKYQPEAGYRFYASKPGPDNTNSLFVCLTFSGGGTRAAAFSYGALCTLKETDVLWPASAARKVRLLDEVDVISSVSGGSFTSAYYGLFGDGIFDDFEEKFLHRDIEGELVLAVLNPMNWFRLLSNRFDRIDLAAEIYSDTIFQNRNIADIQRRSPRPFVVMNATNMTTGAQFSFRQEQFDIIGSDIGSYPVGNAVAASSAFPLLLSPVTLKNHPSPEGFELPPWIRIGVDDRRGNPRRYQLASSLKPYAQDKKHHPYVHLVDGGLSDNLGLRMVIDEYRRGFIRQLLSGMGRIGEAEAIQKLLIIVVNSKTDRIQKIDQSGTSPGALEVLYKAATVSMDNYTFETVELMRDDIDARLKTQARIEAVRKLFEKEGIDPPDIPALRLSRLELYVVEISFDDILDPQERQRFLNLPTSLNLERDQVRDLIKMGGKLLEENPNFQDFLAALPRRP